MSTSQETTSSSGATSTIHGGARAYPQTDLFNAAPVTAATAPPPLPSAEQQQATKWRPMGSFPSNPLPPPAPQQMTDLQKLQSAPSTAAASTQQPTTRKIDPNQMPNPTILDATTTPSWSTRNEGQTPPPPAIKPAQIIDTGNCNPRFMRMTMYTLPATPQMTTTTGLPLGALLCPLADTPSAAEAVPVVDCEATNGGPVRCSRCRAYLNPFDRWVDGGRSYYCSLCNCKNDVEDAFFSPLGPDGRRADIASHPELTHGTVELSITAPMYLPNGPAHPPALCFVLDVSEASVASGVVALVSSCLKSMLSQLPQETRVAIITYNTAVHFWNLNLSPPRMLVVPDVDSMFLPISNTSLLANQTNSLEYFLTNITTIAQQQLQSHRTGPASLGAAIEAANLLLNKIGGRALVFNCSMPTGGPGALKDRSPQDLGANQERERSLLSPQTNFYRTLGAQCAANEVAVDLFLFGRYSDVSSIGEVSRLTSGQVYNYAAAVLFDVARDSWAFESDLRRNLTRTWGYDGSLRVRVGQGLSVAGYMGHYAPAVNSLSTDDVDLPNIDADKSIAVVFKHDESLDESTEVVIQAALLYTTSAGQRRLRLNTISLPCSRQYTALFRGCDCDAITCLMARTTTKQITMGGVTTSLATASLIDTLVDCLAAYRKHCTTNPSPGQLILPESLRLLPLYLVALQKLPVLRPDTPSDARSTAIRFIDSATVHSTMLYLYPSMFALHTLLAQGAMPTDVPLPPTVRLGSEYVTPQGVYLMDDGHKLTVWVGAAAAVSVLQNLFGTEGAQTMSPIQLTQAFSSTVLQQLAGEASTTSPVYGLIGAIAQQHMHSHFSIQAVKQADCTDAAYQAIATMIMMEDKQTNTMSYMDFLCHLHRQIQLKLS